MGEVSPLLIFFSLVLFLREDDGERVSPRRGRDVERRKYHTHTHTEEPTAWRLQGWVGFPSLIAGGGTSARH